MNRMNRKPDDGPQQPHSFHPPAHPKRAVKKTEHSRDTTVRVDTNRHQSASSMRSDNMTGASETQKERHHRKKKTHRGPRMPHFELEQNVHDYEGDEEIHYRDASKTKKNNIK